MANMEVPDFIPEEDKIERKREQIEEMYAQLGMETAFQEDLFEAQDVISNAGAFPDTRIGDHMVNVVLAERLQELASNLSEQAREVTGDVGGTGATTGGMMPDL